MYRRGLQACHICEIEDTVPTSNLDGLRRFDSSEHGVMTRRLANTWG